MNKHQKLVRFGGLAILIGMALVPPWKFSSTVKETGKQDSSTVGYYALWNPPNEEVEIDEGHTDLHYRIDLIRLGVQFGLILVLMNGGVYFLKKSGQ